MQCKNSFVSSTLSTSFCINLHRVLKVNILPEIMTKANLLRKVDRTLHVNYVEAFILKLLLLCWFTFLINCRLVPH